MSLTVEQLAERIAATLRGSGSATVSRCVGLDEAGPGDVSFLANRRYLKALTDTRAQAVILSPKDVAYAGPNLTLLISEDPYFAFREAMVLLHGFRAQPEAGVSNQAQIHETAQIGPDCSIQPMVYIAAGARIGRGCVIYPNGYVGPNAVVGDECVLYPNVTIYNDCVLGDRVTLHAGCVIGQDGFGYATHGGAHHKIPQIGNVIVEDDVEMGAGCTIDRATVGSTRIGKGTKFSDLVAIGHGATIGDHNLLVAQVGIAGSTQTGDYVVMGGQAGVAGHLKIGHGTQIAAKAGVVDDLPAQGQYGGQPALPMNQAKRSVLSVARLPQLIQDVRALQKRCVELEKQIDANLPASSHARPTGTLRPIE